MEQNNICEKILYSEEIIQNKVSELGKKITEDYKNDDIVFIAILNGAFMFCGDLMKRIDLNCTIDFMQVSTYGNETKSSGTFIVKKDLSVDIEGKHVIIVEDILDTGYTLYNLKGYLAKYKPKSVKIATFIDKPARREQPVKADYVCFTMEDDSFIVGYGLDYAQKYRNLPFVGILKEEIYDV